MYSHLHDSRPEFLHLQVYYTSTRTQRLEMKQTLVRLKFPSKLLAHIELLELRQHLETEISKLQYEFALDDADKLLGKGI